MSQFKLSVVIPTHQENDDTYLKRMAEAYPQHPHIEYWVVDSGTDDAWLNGLKRSDFNILKTAPETRAHKLNLGFQKATGDIVFFHHPRSLVDPNGFQYLMDHKKEIGWGGFTHKFDRTSLGLLFTSWYSNSIRPCLWQVLYLDHCIFFKREMLTRQIPNVPIFEDTELSLILKENDRPEILPFVAKTSSIRFQKNGFLKQALLNQKMKLEYFLGRSRNKMNDQYEKDLNLNG